ncbi:MAG: HD domain-containing protein [Dehalococcoidia bacterium]|nr:HD domain-containing protein [Dehalococcoidia bacterium]
MSDNLRLLMVEDDENDAAFLLRHLRKAGFETESLRVQTREAMRDALLTGRWDIVVSDYKMPRFSGPEALRTLRESGVDIPILIVSGAVGEEAAVECMRLGAADFMMKDRLSRLGPAIRRELVDAESRRARKKAERHLLRSEASARRIIESSGDGMLVLDAQSDIRFANPEAAIMLGKSVDELVGGRFGVPLSFGVGIELDVNILSGKPGTVEMKVTEVEWEGEDSYLVTMHDVTQRKRTEEELRASYVNLADTLSRALASRDPYTSGHQHRVADLVSTVGRNLGLPEEQLWELRLGALLHDVGKVAIPEVILNKPGVLTVEELALARTHAEEGYAILAEALLPKSVALMALHHHERMDGSGYPQGLSGDALSELDRIIIVCNVAEAMSSFRPYRRGARVEGVVKELTAGRGVKYEADVVDSVVHVLAKGEFILRG